MSEDKKELFELGTCEHCGCRTNAKIRSCCIQGHCDDTRPAPVEADLTKAGEKYFGGTLPPVEAVAEIVLRSNDPLMAQIHGKKPTAADRAILLRSALVHSEIEFSTRVSFSDCRGKVSMSATRQDDCKCTRGKPIGYTHPERWRCVYIPVTASQERLILDKFCQMADITYAWDDALQKATITSFMQDNGCYYGPNALKYDLPAVMFGFISRRRIWKGGDKLVFCSEACAIALMQVWPDLLCFSGWATHKNGERLHQTVLKPDQVSPYTLDQICRYKFSEKGSK